MALGIKKEVKHTVYFDGTVETTVEQGAPYATSEFSYVFEDSDFPDALMVTFNGVKYIAPLAAQNPGQAIYGDFMGSGDFLKFPFSLLFTAKDRSGGIVTEEAGTYSVKLESEETSTVVSEDFKSAAQSAVIFPVRLNETFNPTNATGQTFTSDKTFDEMLSAFKSGKLVVLHIIAGAGAGPCPIAVPLMYYGEYMGGLFGGTFTIPYISSSKAYSIMCNLKYNDDKWYFSIV